MWTLTQSLQKSVEMSWSFPWHLDQLPMTLFNQNEDLFSFWGIKGKAEYEIMDEMR